MNARGQQQLERRFWQCVPVLIAIAVFLFLCNNHHSSSSRWTIVAGGSSSAHHDDGSSSSLRTFSSQRRSLSDDAENAYPDGVEVGVIKSEHHHDSTSATHRPLPETTVEEEEEEDENAVGGGGGGPWAAMEWLLLTADSNNNQSSTSISGDRCDWLWNEFEQHTSWMTHDQRAERYHHQTTDASNYYRASSHIFWVDFVLGNWSQALRVSKLQLQEEDNDYNNLDELLLDEYATYTWVSGDLHLLNLGAWKNRHGDIVFGMNDFDEGAVQDFQVDLMRLAISIYDQVLGTLGGQAAAAETARRVVLAFADAYVDTVLGYVGNEDALTTELTTETAVGSLKTFLESLQDDSQYSREQQLQKYAKFDDDDGRWRFQKGTPKKPKHKLVKVSSETESKIRRAFSATEYGGTLPKFGWSLTGRWDENFYEVLDVAARIGSGIGSYGVERYYVLIRGDSTDDEDSPSELGPIILDVKHQPPGSFRRVISPSDEAWYDKHFVHSAARVTEAQRKLTAFTDQFTGWLLLDGDEDVNSPPKPFTVRERSPWKEDFDLDSLTDEDSLMDHVNQVGFTAATSHVRGNIAQAPGDFKNVIKIMLGDPSRLEEWSGVVADLAAAYHEQILLDFECFRSRVQTHYPI